jgi:TolB-like protein
MSSIVPGYEYDIFISYRHNDNRSGWVTDFVNALQEELAATIKEPLSIYFDKNPHDGLLETHNVDKSLEGKLKCLIFIPILSQTYCDSNSFAWQHEFCAFNKIAGGDQFGRDIKLNNGNVTSRILPIKIHDLDTKDKVTFEKEIGGVLRPIEFIFKSPGVNRPLHVHEDHATYNQNKTFYRDQINKAANAIKEIILSLQGESFEDTTPIRTPRVALKSIPQKKIVTRSIIAMLVLAAVFSSYYFITKSGAANPAAIDDPSLAVVPFANLSNDPNQEYISDGVMEAVLNHLNKIEGLRLTSRTTMMTYKGTRKTIKEIADEVGVRYVLEGSVQKVENTIRINAQLIDGMTDEHVWSEFYDRNISDLLAIQSEVAQQIAGKLKVKIQPNAKSDIEYLPTKNQEAYDLYLKASHQPVRSPEFRNLLTKAIELDSTFADAYAALGWHYTLRGLFDYPAREAVQRAEPLLSKALSLDRNCVVAHSSLGFLSLWFKWDLYASEREFNITAQLEPANISSMNTDPIVAMGKFNDAVEIVRRKVKTEPNNIHHKIDLGFVLYFAGQEEEAMYWIDSARITADPQHPAYTDLSRAYLYAGRYKQAIEVNEKYRRFLATPDFWPRVEALDAIAYFHLGQKELTQKKLQVLKNAAAKGPNGSAAFYAAMVFAQIGEPDLAFQYLDKAYQAQEVEMYWAGVEPPFEPLRKEQRWQVILDRINFPIKF